jgi:hypothetical protein
MPIPKPNDNESNKDFIARCMANPSMNKDYKDSGQRYAICISQTKTKSSTFEEACEILSYRIKDEQNEYCGDYEQLTEDNLIIPNEDDYVDFDEPTEEYEIELHSKFEYKHPVTNEIFQYDRKGVYTKEGRTLVYVGKSSEYQGRKVTLNKPFRTPNGPKKMSVYVKNEKGNVVKVNFGDPNMKIKKNIPERRKSFRARHNCDNPGPKWKARYWSCKAW